MNEFPKCSKMLYRDVIKVIKNLMEPSKQKTMMKFVRTEFEKNRKVKNESEILRLKKQAANGIMNLYLTQVKSQIKDKPPNPNEKRINF